MSAMSSLEGEELHAHCALSLCWWEGSLGGYFLCNHLKSGEVSLVRGSVVTIAHSSSAAVLAPVKERKPPFSVAVRCQPWQSPSPWAQPPSSEKAPFSVMETSRSSVAPAVLKQRSGYLNNLISCLYQEHSSSSQHCFNFLFFWYCLI